MALKAGTCRDVGDEAKVIKELASFLLQRGSPMDEVTLQVRKFQSFDLDICLFGEPKANILTATADAIKDDEISDPPSNEAALVQGNLDLTTGATEEDFLGFFAASPLPHVDDALQNTDQTADNAGEVAMPDIGDDDIDTSNAVEAGAESQDDQEDEPEESLPEPGLVIAIVGGRRKVRRLHRWKVDGACNKVPGVHYHHYENVPSNRWEDAVYDDFCRTCWRAGATPAHTELGDRRQSNSLVVDSSDSGESESPSSSDPTESDSESDTDKEVT